MLSTMLWRIPQCRNEIFSLYPLCVKFLQDKGLIPDTTLEDDNDENAADKLDARKRSSEMAPIAT